MALWFVLQGTEELEVRILVQARPGQDIRLVYCVACSNVSPFLALMSSQGYQKLQLLLQLF